MHVSLQNIDARAVESATVAFGKEPFDSEVFGLEIGRIHTAHASSPAAYRRLFDSVLSDARSKGYDQVLRRARLDNLAEIWGLEGAGFELMDVVVTFARRVAPGVSAPEWTDLRVDLATDATVEELSRDMVDDPWGSRYEADPAYAAADVRELRRRWLMNSHRGRAQAFFIGTVDGRIAGYVTCMLHQDTAAGTVEGEIELVGTLPAHRGRRVASRIIEHALCWFGERCETVTVRTQATNIAAANLYERAGFTLRASEATFRANLTHQVNA
jgi:ribosomal protein S18 acetylase RimI-like enzyme